MPQIAPPPPPQKRFLITWWQPALMLLVGTAFFAAIAADLHFKGRLAQADKIIAPYLHAHSNPILLFLASGFSRTGGGDVVVGIGFVTSIYLIRKHNWRAVAVIAWGLMGSGMINQMLKDYYAIPRPMTNTFYRFTANDGFSFPSGHTMGATIIAGLLVLLWNHLHPVPPRKRLWLALAATAWGILVAASLLYVGVHYLTDVLAGLGISLAWLGVLRAALPPRAYDNPTITSAGEPREVHSGTNPRPL